MYKLKKLKFIISLSFFCILLSCQNDLELPDINENNYFINSQKLAQIGKKLKNPYTVENMRKALQKLKEKGLDKSSTNSGRIIEDLEIVTSHLYVMYEPETIQEEAELKQDSTLILADYPLDYDFTQEDLDARPALMEQEIPDYYTAIRIDSEAAGDQSYILMDELYIPEDDPYFQETDLAIAKTTDPNVINSKEDLLRHLLFEAYKLTGNESELEQVPLENGRWIFGTRWWPSGTIEIYDEIAGANKPVVGAQVLIRQWFTVRQGITNSNGYFSTSSVRGSSRYVIQWERYNYSIRNGSLFQAETRGPVKKDEAWNYTITSGDNKYHALIHQAAYDYYYGTRFGLTSPPQNGFDIGTIQMKIAAREVINSSTGSSYSHSRSDFTLGLLSQIHIKAWGSNSDRVYGTTIHELTHAQHSMVDRNSYDNLVRDAYTFPIQGGAVDNNKRTLETWARTVEIAMTLQRYKNQFGIVNYSYYKNGYVNYQYQTIFENNHYTSAGYDMTDNFNQRSVYGVAYPNDRVSGYTLKQLQDALVDARSWWQWRDNIKNKYDNPTEIYLDELFNNWTN